MYVKIFTENNRKKLEEVVNDFLTKADMEAGKSYNEIQVNHMEYQEVTHYPDSWEDRYTEYTIVLNISIVKSKVI